jgi:peptidoglycan/LPS O-acetylase OafA/YrhL
VTGRKRQQVFRRDIEGLRAIAIIAVVLYHSGVVKGGYVGVDVFFVVSGFLITGLLWREIHDHGHISFARFYARRARRLLPASAFVLLATLIASALILSPLRMLDVTKDAKAAALYVANFRFAAQRTNYLAASTPPSPLQHYWSLGVEEQFYAVWPVFMLGVAMLVRRTRRYSTTTAMAALGIVAALSFALSVAWTHSSQPWAFFSLPTRAWELALGGIVAIGAPAVSRLPERAAHVLGWAGLAAIGWSVLMFTDSTVFPGMAALVPAGGAAALIVAGTVTKRGAVATLTHRPFQVLGRISYSWYLWHWPVLVLAAAKYGHALAIWQALVCSALSLMLAAGSFLLVEYPIHFSPFLAKRFRLSLALGGALTAAALIAAVATAATVPALNGGGSSQTAANLAAAVRNERAGNPWLARVDAIEAPLSTAISDAVDTRNVPSNLDPSLLGAAGDKAAPFVDGCDNSFTDATVRRCQFGDTESKTTIVLFGDSHAAQWFPALDAMANQRKWRLLVLTKATCPPVEISIYSPVLGRRFTECDQWRTAALARIRAEKPLMVIAGAARHYGPEYDFHVYGAQWISGLTAMVRDLRTMTRHVVMLGPTPKPTQDVPSCLSEHLSDVSACVPSLAESVNAAGQIAERNAVVSAGGSYLRVPSWLCTRSRCPVVVDNLLAYRDDNHLTTTITTWLAPLVAAELEAVLHGSPVSGG